MFQRMSAADYRASLAVAKKASRSKYGAVRAYRCEKCGRSVVGAEEPCCGGAEILNFDSTGEATRWDELRMHQRVGLVRDLRRQVAYDVIVAGKKIGKYVADFVWIDNKGDPHIEDYKGMDTAVSKLKRRAVEAHYGIAIKIVKGR